MSSVLEPLVESTEEETPYRFTTEEFYRLLDLDFFPEEARVELWEGRIYEKMAKTQSHAVASIDTSNILMRSLPPGWCLSVENPITINETKAPLPDLIVLKGKGKDYLNRRPDAADVGLVVEFSLSSLKLDTGSKLEAYARAGIAAYWVLNLKDNVVHVYELPIPEEGRFASEAKYGPGESIPFKLEGIQVTLIAASEILPIA